MKLLSNAVKVVGIFTFLSASVQGAVLNEIAAEPGAKQQEWLIPAIVDLPMNTPVLDEKEASKYEPRKLAASLIERKRRFDDRWSDASAEAENVDKQAPLRYELVSFFPEEFIESLIKNGHLNGHELPQTVERQKETAILREDIQIVNDKERFARLCADAKFMKGRGQFEAALELNRAALALAKSIDVDKVKEIEDTIAFLEKVAKDPSVAATRAYGWERRADLEDLHLGIKIGDKYKGGERNLANSLRAKYGIVNILSPTEIQVSRRELVHYGAVIIVYRDELAWRSSYSFGDSTVLSKDERTGLLKGPKLRAMQEFSLADPEIKTVPFIELQVWGPIDLADIKEFRVPEGRADLVALLSKAALPIYTYKRKELGDDPPYVPAQNLGIGGLTKVYAGDPAIEDEYRKLRLKRISQL